MTGAQLYGSESSSGLFDVKARPWLRDLARSYAEWTAVANGRNLKPRDRIKQEAFRMECRVLQTCRALPARTGDRKHRAAGAGPDPIITR